MKREHWKRCPGCCWMKRVGEIIWMCLERECPFHPFTLTYILSSLRSNTPAVEESFT